MMKEENKNTVNECKRLLTEINNNLNKAIANSTDSMLDTDRALLRKIRDENIDTFILIQKMEMVGTI